MKAIECATDKFIYWSRLYSNAKQMTAYKLSHIDYVDAPRPYAGRGAAEANRICVDGRTHQ